MNAAVALVDAYLQINGYFTVIEYPVIERQAAGYREATDLDVLAFRFPGAGRWIPGSDQRPRRLVTPDPELGAASGQADMIIGEIKEGKATINRGARRSAIIEAALARFGCCDPDQAPAAARRLLTRGRARTGHGHDLRLVAFGSLPGNPGRGVQTILLGHVAAFLTEHVRANWKILSTAQFGHPAMSMLIALEKASRGFATQPSPSSDEEFDA